MNLHTLPTAQVGLEANVLSPSDRGRLQSPMADISDATSFSTSQPRQGVFALFNTQVTSRCHSFAYIYIYILYIYIYYLILVGLMTL